MAARHARPRRHLHAMTIPHEHPYDSDDDPDLDSPIEDEIDA